MVTSESRLFFQRHTHPHRCHDDPSKCNQGAQQPLYFRQLDGNNVDQFGGERENPAYLE